MPPERDCLDCGQCESCIDRAMDYALQVLEAQDEPDNDGLGDCPFCEGDGCIECDGTGRYV